MVDEPRQIIVVPSWHSVEVETAKGYATDIPQEGVKAPNGIAIGAVECGEQICLMIAISKDGESLAGVLSLADWNCFNASIQLALMDAAQLLMDKAK